MAIFSKIVIAASAFAAMTAAFPLNARMVTSMVTETAYTTVDVAVTLWVDENGTPLSTVAPGNFAAAPTTPASVATTSSSAPTSSAPVQSQQVVASSFSTSYTYSSSTTLATLAVTPVISQPPQTTTSQQARQVADPTTTSVVAAASPSASNAASGGSTDGSIAVANTECSGPSSACSGDITHYDGGQSACGPIVDSNSQMAIALPFEFMGTASNNNPYCGKTLTIRNPTSGVEVQAYVADKCMGCTGRSIDLTNALFNAVAPSCDGRCSGFEWWFN